MRADPTARHPLPDAGAHDAGRLYTMRELFEAPTLVRLREAFSRISDAPLALLDNEGKVITAPRGFSRIKKGFGHRTSVMWKSNVLGHVVLLAEKPTTNGIKFAELVADLIGYLCHQEARIRKRVNELTMVYDLGGLVAGSTDLTSILNAAARKVCDVVNAHAAGVRILNEATGELVISGASSLSAEYLAKGVIRVDENPIDREALTGKVVYIEDARDDPRIRYPAHARREGLVSGLCCPMTYRGRTVGVIRVYTKVRHRFSQFEVELLRAVASQAAGAVVNSRLITERMEVDHHERQLRYAGQVQRRMIPQGPPSHPLITFGQVYEPSLALGGDFYDYLSLPGGNVGVAIADVVGKGLPGALMMASVRSALRAHAHSIFDLNEIVGEVNRHLCRDTLVSEFATMFYGVFSTRGDRFTFCNAGHNPPLHLRGDAFRELDTGGMVIGVDTAEAYEREVLDIAPGDILVFYTDGVNEALNFEGVAYGIDRLRESILRYRNEPAGTMANQLLWDVRRFVGLSDQRDDITIVVAKIA